jgi:mannose-1-phosphate guanylyltransferase
MASEKSKNEYCVIMAGGVGSRFWPMSRTEHPKQFIDVLGTGRTLLQQTYDRFVKICRKENILVVTNESYVDLVSEQLPDLKPSNILSEPTRKNTAPCIAYAAYRIAEINPDGLMVVAPSDHLITKEETFLKAIRSCFRKAGSEDCLVTLGINPTRPDTGYGYIQFREPDVKEKDKRIKRVKTFTEKPDHDMAKFFMESGDFLWNSGIFIWSIKSILKEIENSLPELTAVFKEGHGIYNTPKETEFIRKAYSNCKNVSIDYGVMEKAANVYVRSSIIGWSDLGTWGSLYDHIRKNEHANAIVGKNVMMYDSKNCIVNVPKDKLVVIEGLDGYIVAESDDILLICKKQDEQQIRNIVHDVKVKKGDRFV